jgi:hypothetical protein
MKTPKGTPCPMYHYCPEGTSAPVPCDNSFNTTSEGASDVTYCVKCPRGYYCKLGDYFKNNIFNPSTINNVISNSNYYGKCQAGYVCLEGSTVSNPTDNIAGYICPQGAYCPAGTPQEIQCSPGTYNSLTGQTTSCQKCPAGSVC